MSQVNLLENTLFSAVLSGIMAKCTVLPLFLCAAWAFGAFESCPESPWLFGFPGALFPRTASALALNPVTPGMLESPGFAVSASRPFGLAELQRLSVAANTVLSGVGLGAMYTGTSTQDYSETTLAAAGAVRPARGLLLGVSLSGNRLSIQGYGGKTAFGVSAAVVARPVQGVYLGGGWRGLFSTELAGAPAIPGVVHVSCGVVPVDRMHLAASAAFHRHTGAEFGLHSSFSPHPNLALGVGCLSGPTRLSFSIGIDVGRAGVSYGYATHPDLPGSQSGEVSWGASAFGPPPLSLAGSPPGRPPVVFPVNINTATESELTAIPGIGPAKASAILAWLEANGPVESVSELLNVPGVGPSTLETLCRYLTVE